MTKKLILAALVGASVFAVAPASATRFVLNGGATVNVPPTQTVNITPADITTTGGFQDYFVFTLGSTFTVTSSIISTQATQTSNLDFGTVEIRRGDGVGGALVASYSNGTLGGGSDFTRLMMATLNADTYSIVVNGNVVGAPARYDGNITFEAPAVPEPATWGMMLLGFGLIGAAARRSRKITTVLA